MARVTVEDCLENVKNRFELVMLASKRARQLMRGSSEPKVAWENDKATVVALREIAMGYTDFSDVHYVEHVQKPAAHSHNEIIDLAEDSDHDDDMDIKTDEIKTETHSEEDTSTHEVTTSDDHTDSE